MSSGKAEMSSSTQPHCIRRTRMRVGPRQGTQVETSGGDIQLTVENVGLGPREAGRFEDMSLNCHPRNQKQAPILYVQFWIISSGQCKKMLPRKHFSRSKEEEMAKVSFFLSLREVGTDSVASSKMVYTGKTGKPFMKGRTKKQ